MITVVGWIPILLALIVTIWNISQRRWFNLFLLMGYIAYAVVFNYANMTHDYYLLVLFPIVSVSWGEFFRWFVPWYKYLIRDYQKGKRSQSITSKLFERRYASYVAVAVATYLLTIPWNDYTPLLIAGPYEPGRWQAEVLGMQLGFGSRVIALTNDYAMPLRYFSGLHAQWWPTQADLWYEGLAGGHVLTATERLDKMLARARATHFIITLESEYHQQKDLVELMKQYRELPTHPEGVRIFELQR